MKRILVLWAVAALLFTGCDENCEEICEPEGSINDITDLIGFLDPNQTGGFELATLYVEEAFLTDVISALGAEDPGTGVYTMSVENFDGTIQSIYFTAFFTDSPYQFLTNDDPEEVKSKYKVYKDAECKTGADEPQITPCREHEGNYRKLEFLGWDSCEKGSGICVEIQKIIWIERIYEDSGCTILIDLKSTKQYDC